MRNIFTLLFFILLFSSVNAQSWFGDNARWVYGADDLDSGKQYRTQLYIDGTMDINNVVTKVIKSNQRIVNYNTDDTTFIETIYGFGVEGEDGAFAVYENDFVAIYDSELNVAEILSMPLDNGTFVDLEIDQIGDETIDGVPLRFLNMRIISTCDEINNEIIKIYDRIGVVDGLMEGYRGPFVHRMLDCFDEFPRFELICYADGEFSYPEGTECNDIFDAVTSTSEFNNQLAFDIYPNPAHDFIQINNEVNANIRFFELYNAAGLKMNQLHFDNHQINVSAYQPGIYFLKVFFDNGQVGVKRVVLR